MRCVAALLAKNEADRYLTQAVRAAQLVCDTVLLLDDGSTDDTIALAEELGCQVRSREAEGMWGKESAARAQLWSWGAEEAGDGWLFVLDADHELVAPTEAWRGMLETWQVNAWGIPLYDCWDDPQRHRADGHWQGYQVARPWLFRPSVCPHPTWSGRGLHSGHAPINYPYHMGVAPSGVWLRHYGWMSATDREAKLARYLAHQDQLRPDELAHLHTVTDAHSPTDA